MLIVGLTGGIATGKSTVSGMLKEEMPNIPLLDLDLVARQITEKGTSAYNAIVARFGQEILAPDGTLDRKRLGEIVFNDENQRRFLNSVTHPAIRKHILKWLIKHFLIGSPVVIIDAPLLFEAGLHKLCGMTVVVYTDEKTQLNRLMQRNNYTVQEAVARISAQMHIDKKTKLATVVIDNNGSLDETRRQIQCLVSHIEAESKRWRLFSRKTLILASIATILAVMLAKIWLNM